MGFLIDTNALSELRKGARMDANVRRWFDTVKSEDIYLSALVLGEIRHGIELLRRRDPEGAERLENWLYEVREEAADRILPVSADIAECWGRMGIPDPISVIDGLMSATAIHHNLTLVTRNVRDVARTGAAVMNPFEAEE
jgi:predicted nucleic acid-binding protein